MIRAGRLKRRVTFQRNEPATRDDYGQPVENWQDIATVWASIRPLSGRELWYARQTLATATHQIVCRWSAGTTATLTGACRAVTVSGRTFHGEFAANAGTRNRRVEFTCSEAPLPALVEVIDNSGSRALIDDTGRNGSNWGHAR